MQINTIPRTIVNAGLQGIRLPLTAVERLTARGGDGAWPPTIAFESFSAEAKTRLGSVLRDAELVRDGRVQRVRAQELSQAARLRAEAARTRAEADDRAQARRSAADQARDQVDHQAEERERRLAKERAAKERRTRERARRKKEAVEEVAGARDEVVTAEEQAARAIGIDEEAQALARRQEALDASRQAGAIDDAIEATKARREAARDAAASDW